MVVLIKNRDWQKRSAYSILYFIKSLVFYQYYRYKLHDLFIITVLRKVCGDEAAVFSGFGSRSLEKIIMSLT